MKVIGIMSGTSLDGIDVALCEIIGQPPRLQAKILQTGTVAYDSEFRGELLDLCQPATIDKLCRLNFSVAERIANAIQEIIGDLSEVDLIGSHGQTVWHELGSTLQIGSGSVIAERTGVTTINNFRERDIAAGGQGAPLTAYGDWLLLRHPDHWRAIQNIGGMGNVTFLPPLSDEKSGLLAFDTGPGNALIDAAMLRLKNLPYDRGGEVAASGQVQEDWLHELLAHPFFQQAPPRTTGRELFGSAMASELVKTGLERAFSAEDIIATLTALTAHSIANAYRNFALQFPMEVILGGGGSHNQALVNWLGELVAPAQVMNHEALGLSSDFKEALVFAMLAYETWHNRVGTLPLQTGQNASRVLGQITPGNNYAELCKQTWR